MTKEFIFGLVGGLGLFIYGIYLMGEGLQHAAGDRLRGMLKALTRNALSGTAVGAVITSLVQSSSATTVMTVGFVNAGLMTFKQSIGVIFGANIGTTITAQIVAFKLTQYALPSVAIGAVLYLFVNRRFWKYFGLFFLGFGILFLGFSIMGSTVKPFAKDPAVQEIFVRFGENPFLGIAIGALITAIVQSSSVTTGIVVGLAAVGLLDLKSGIAIIFGCNIGTCVTAMLASIGTTVSARRVAIGHLLFNLIGTLIILPLLPIYDKIVMLTAGTITRQVANAHTIFNLINTCIFLPFAGLYANFIIKIVPGKDVIIDTKPKYLEKHLLNTPLAALDATTREIIDMAELARSMIDDAMRGFQKGDIKSLSLISKKEVVVDNLQEEITNYVMALTRKELTEEDTRKIPALLHSVNDIERIGDHSENLKELAERKISLNLPFSDEAKKEIGEMYSIISVMANETIKCLSSNDPQDAKVVIEIEHKIDKLTEQLRQGHIDRLNKGACKVLSGIVFLDMVSNFEKIGDHFTNVAQAVMDRLQWQT